MSRGAGHGGYNDISLVSTGVSKRKANAAHIILCHIQREVSICDVEGPIIEDSSSLLAEISVQK